MAASHSTPRSPKSLAAPQAAAARKAAAAPPQPNGEPLVVPIDMRGARVAFVLGGGGLKGFAHIGALRALVEAGISPSLVAGTSIGALIGSAWVGGLALDEMERRAIALQKREIFRLNHLGMLRARARATSIYLEEPLRELAEGACPTVTFEELAATGATPLLVNTVDVERGTQVVWGAPGLRDVPVSDAVYASCALPGFFPPGRVDGRVCIDGGTMDNLPVSIAGVDADAVIAVDVGNGDLTHATDVTAQGFAAVYMRAATTMMHALERTPLEHWQGPPMLLVRPRLGKIGWFSFGHAEELVAEGYRATRAALAQAAEWLEAPGGVYPRRVVQVAVDRERCTGCGICVALAPQIMALDRRREPRRAYALTSSVRWSPADGEFVRHCPTDAIRVTEPGAAAVEVESPTPAISADAVVADPSLGGPAICESDAA